MSLRKPRKTPIAGSLGCRYAGLPVAGQTLDFEHRAKMAESGEGAVLRHRLL